MDIKLPLDANLKLAINKANDAGLGLRLNQVVEAKVIETQTVLDTFTLKINDKAVTAQAKLPIVIQPGQSFQLQVIKLLPNPELKLLSSLLPSSEPPNSTQTAQQQTFTLINTPILASTISTANPAPANAPPLLINGQQLQATVIAIEGDKVTLQLTPPNTGPQQTNRPDALLLTLDTKQLVTSNPNSITNLANQTAVPLKEGTVIQLQAIKSDDKPVFLVTSTTTDLQQKIIEAFKQMLPLQTSPTPLLNQLQQALPSLLADASIAETLKTLAQKILSDIPGKTQLTETPQLRQAIKESGLFMESKLIDLLQGKPNVSVQDDFKFKLSKLIQLLTQELATQTHDKSASNNELLKESLQKAQSAFAKLTLDQLNSLPKEESPKQSWVLELPFFHDNQHESVKIDIERDKDAYNDDSQKNWAVSVTITPPDLGTIHCRISCYDGSVNTRFWSETAGTVEKINAHLHYLKHQFEMKGLNPGFMEAHQGQPTQTDTVKTPIPHLLSEKA